MPSKAERISTRDQKSVAMKWACAVEVCLLAFCVSLLFAGSALAQAPLLIHGELEGEQITAPTVVPVGTSITISLRPPDADAEPRAFRVTSRENEIARGVATPAEDGSYRLEGVQLGSTGLSHYSVVLEKDGEAWVATGSWLGIPGPLTFLPPFIAIALALIFRQVLISLFAGVWCGALILHHYHPVAATMSVIDEYALKALADEDHASILIFSLLLGGMISLITSSGGGLGLAALVAKRARTAVKSQIAAWCMGLVIFFDDYANSLLVGSSMRPITDKLRVSREKLAFVVDATAAPVASIALVSSWIGVEIAYIGEQYSRLGIEGDPYLVFLETLQYRFYPILMLVFVVACAWTRRDFGPMLKAEQRARREGKVLRDGAEPASDFGDHEVASLGVTPRWANAVVPIIVVIFTAIAGMVFTGSESLAPGEEATLRAIFGGANSYAALLWASFTGGFVAFAMVIGQKSMSVSEAVSVWLKGIRAMMLACLILILAWSLNSVCDELMTAQYLIHLLSGVLTPTLLPLMVFIAAAVVSFATGTSWGTMAILFPLVVPMAHSLAPGQEVIMLGAMSSILTGAVWGDHCSPISDTTIMSSMATSCDHMDHVRTQIPYALTVGLVSILVGELGTALGLYPAWVGMLLGVAVLLAVLRFVGKPVDDYSVEEADAQIS